MSNIRVKQIEDIHTDETYLSEDLKITTKFGEVSQFDAGKTYATISATKPDGTPKTLNEALLEMLSKDSDPTVTAPTTTAAVSPNGTTVECGSTVNPTATPKLTDGSYSVGGKTTQAGCAVTGHKVALQVNGTLVQNLSTETDGAKLTFNALTAPATDGQTITADVTTTYAAGTAMPLTALESERPALKIAAGTATRTGLTLCTARRGRFYGAFTENPTGSENIRKLGKNLTYGAGSTFNISLTAGTKGAVVALPGTLAVRSIEAILTTSQNLDISAEFVKTEVSVADASGANAIAYNVWTFAPAKVLGTEVIKITLKA